MTEKRKNISEGNSTPMVVDTPAPRRIVTVTRRVTRSQNGAAPPTILPPIPKGAILPPVYKMVANSIAEQDKNIKKITDRINNTTDKAQLKGLEKSKALMVARREELKNELNARNLLATPASEPPEKKKKLSDEELAKKKEEDELKEKERKAAEELIKKINADRTSLHDEAMKSANEIWLNSKTYNTKYKLKEPTKGCAQSIVNLAVGNLGESIDIGHVMQHFKDDDVIVLTQITAPIVGVEKKSLRFDHVVIDKKTGQLLFVGETKTNTADFSNNQKIIQADPAAKVTFKLDADKNPNIPAPLDGKVYEVGRESIFVNRIIITSND